MSTKKISQIGIVGGGSGARMLCIEAIKKGIRTTLLDPQINSIGSEAATEHMIAPFTEENIKKLSLRSDAIIFNIEVDYRLKANLDVPTYPNREALNKLMDKKQVLDILEELKIPTIHTYYQDNRGDTFNRIDEIDLPFKLVKQYEDRVETAEIFTQEELAEAVLEMDEQVESFILQPISDYVSTVTCMVMADKKGNIFTYQPIEEYDNKNQLERMTTTSSLSKTMLQKIERYNKKLLKNLNTSGLFTISYGVKSNKGVELIEIVPRILLAGLLTQDAYDVSLYEQYIHLVLGMELVEPTLVCPLQGTLLDQVQIKKQPSNPKNVYHLYDLGKETLRVTPISE